MGSSEMGIDCLEEPERSLTLRQEAERYGLFIVKVQILINSAPEGQTVVTIMKSTGFLDTPLPPG